jgi:hypothetical protein
MCVVNTIPRLLRRPQGQSACMRKISPTQGVDLRTVQAAQSLSTDYAIPIRKRMFHANNSQFSLLCSEGIQIFLEIPAANVVLIL